MTDAPLMLTDPVLAGLGIGPDEIRDAVEAAILAEDAGRVATAPKAAIVPGDGRYMMATLSTADDPALTVLKTVTVAPDNPSRGLAGIEGAMLLLDSRTGVLRALMAPGWVTGVRTAALSAVAAARMADPASRVIAFVGTGVQARSHLDAMAALFPLAEMRAVGRGPANLDRLCDKARAMGLAATVCETPRDALEGADIVVTSVTLNFDLAPFLDARWLKPGAFAAITDLALPWVPEGMPALAPVVIDSLVQEAASARKMVDPALVAGDLATLVAGRLALPAARTRPSAFVFRGVAIGDFAVAALAYRRAVEASAGVPLPGW